ncbi:VWA domain-containing protein [Streptomyces sp. GbtcB6]|uniref:VWA domain-containing protein n=1 Tax=Streptomyces sp. GbtcB6 TaxID=2824751 RepID=UPI001C2F4CEE|nr:VWA domain-containing protein [Streptomyces sp. GbtcB6]
MGILTLLRNAFGRSRKPRPAEAEGADQLPSQSTPPPAAPQKTPEPETPAAVPEPRPATTDEHDLVSAAFDNVTVPKQATRLIEPEVEVGTTEAAPDAEPTAEADVVAEAEPTAEAEVTPEAEPDAEAEPEPVAEVAPEAEAEPTVEPVADVEAEVTAEPVAEAEPEPVAEVTEEAAPEPEAEVEPVAEVTAEPAAEPVAEGAAAPTAAAGAGTGAEPGPGAEVTEGGAPGAKAEVEPVAEVAAEPTPEPVAEPVAEPGSEPVAGVAPEAETEPTVEPAADVEAEVTEEAAPEPEAEVAEPVAAVAAAEPQSDPEPVAETVAEPTPDAIPDATPEPAPEPAPEPVAAAVETAAPEPAAAADGESAPQGPPAPDNETVTGGAGGNTPAEGEAEAALAKAGLTGTHAATYLVLDRSASMRPYYKDGSAAALADQTLALATRLTPDGDTPSVHVVFFSTEVDGTTDLTPASPENAIDEAHAGLGRMGRTSYHAAVEAVLAHYDKHHDKDATPAAPALVVFQTDGAPDAKTPATQSLTDAAKSHPSVFFSFVAFGEHENKAFDYLRKLKTDNAAFFHAGPTPLELTDAELYDGLLIDWRP